jgi:hypothetical protein
MQDVELATGPELDWSGSDDDLPLAVIVCRPAKKALKAVPARKRQQGYDHKCRKKRKVRSCVSLATTGI